MYVSNIYITVQFYRRMDYVLCTQVGHIWTTTYVGDAGYLGTILLND